MASPAHKHMRHIGTLAVIGVIGALGVRYVLSRAEQAARRPARAVDWEQARRIAQLVSQSDQAPLIDRTGRSLQYAAMVRQSEPLIAEYMGAQLPAPISRVYVVDRREWLEANVASFGAVFDPIEELYSDATARHGALGALFGEINGRIVGTQLGALLGYLARRVLGQYDLSLLSPDPEQRGALYFVEPNIAMVQRQLGLGDADFRLWITLHETTHVFQFEAFPWVRPYFNQLLREFLSQVSDQLTSLSGGMIGLLERIAAREPIDRHWIEMMLTPQQRQIFDRIQALMSIVEGYSNHTMNAIGTRLLPEYQQIEERIKVRQLRRPVIEELFNRVTGMDLKLAQYQQGEAFFNAVVAARGRAYANRVWERAENLPTMAEIRDPQRWLSRMDA
ncbi:MAG TPA: zinc-dependent metalloprotease [Roseiflexaceae bacterium]|nr:zinc-dependent metalloprotease [Roseiflexaceae bacterium]